MDAYFLGELTGRLLASYFIAWFLCFLFVKLDIKRAFKVLHTFKGMSALSFVFLVPYLSHIGGLL